MNNIFKNLKIIFSVLLNRILLKKPDFSDKNLFLNGQILFEKYKKKKIIKDFSEIEFSVFSQFGEDGIINWLIEKFPNIPKSFIEIGTQDYWESNTRFLLKLRSWKGYLIEANNDDFKKIKKQKIYWQNDLEVFKKFVDKNNINSILSKDIKETKIGLLSLDIDGNDYWILKEITNLRPYLFICEYNPIFGYKKQISTVYDPKFDRTKKHFSNLYFGCSIQALIHLMKTKKYSFLGTNSKGMNAFFARNDKLHYVNKFIRNKKIHKSLIREGRKKNGKLNLKSLSENLKLIKNMSIIDTKTMSKKKLGTYKEFF